MVVRGRQKYLILGCVMCGVGHNYIFFGGCGLNPGLYGTQRIPKHKKITQFGALAGQIHHMAAQKVGFTPRPIRYGPPNWHVSGSAALESISEPSLKHAS